MLRFLFVLLSLLFCSSFVRSSSVVTVNSADFTVTVSTLLSAEWKYSQNDNASFAYYITLLAMWETENSTDYDFVANSYYAPLNGWSVTEGNVVNNTQQISLATQKGTSPRFDTLAVNTRVPLWAVNGSDYPAGKFDVEITNYKWVSLSNDAQLILAFLLDSTYQGSTPKGGSPNLTTHGSRTVDFGGAYFSINSTAQGGNPKPNTSIGVELKLASAVNTSQLSNTQFNSINVNNVVYVIYDHFDSNLSHDPEFGFGEGPGASYIWIIIIVVVVIAIIVIILIAVIGFILVRRRRRSYDAF